MGDFLMLIGLSGLAGSGKDTVFQRASVMAERMGLPSPERIAFADKLKQSASRLLGVSVEDLEHWKNDESTGHLKVIGRPMSIRTFLQRYGTEAHRDVFGDMFWVDSSLPLNFTHQGRLVFVTDVRFDNEAQRIRSCGGKNFVVQSSRQQKNQDRHVSELGIHATLTDGIIDNSSFGDGFSSLDQQVRALISEFDDVVEDEFGDPMNVNLIDQRLG